MDLDKPRTVISCAILWLLSGAASLAQPPAAPDPDLERYATPQVLADVGGGRKIHLFCMGSGRPTVILTAGLGSWSETWRKVQPAIARTTRVCAWDRPGFGYSSPSPEPQDVRHTTADLENALRAAHVGPPYVVVGHSLGGYESLMFSDRHRGQVRGMVLIDPSIPDQARILAQNVGPESAAFNTANTSRMTSYFGGCEAGLRAGALTPAKDPNGCLAFPRDYPDSLRTALASRQMDPAKYATIISLIQNVDADGVMVIDRRRNYGHMPMIVLIAGAVPTLPAEFHASQAAVDGFARYGAVARREAYKQLAALSDRGETRLVEGSPHAIQLARPQAVIEAVEQVVAQARSETRGQ